MNLRNYNFPSSVPENNSLLPRNYKRSDIFVRAGSKSYHQGGVTRSVRKLVVHNKFNRTTMANDVALVKLWTALPMTPHIGLVAMARRVPAGGQTVLVSGFGRTGIDGALAKQLMTAKLRYVDHGECYKKFGKRLTRSMICAGDRIKDACKGDSGGEIRAGINFANLNNCQHISLPGPLTKDGFLLGIVSWGYGCANRKYPGVYSSIPAYRSWILRNMR